MFCTQKELNIRVRFRKSNSFELGSQKRSGVVVSCHSNKNNCDDGRGGDDKRSLHILITSFHRILTAALEVKYFDYSHCRDEEYRGVG